MHSYMCHLAARTRTPRCSHRRGSTGTCDSTTSMYNEKQYLLSPSAAAYHYKQYKIDSLANSKAFGPDSRQCCATKQSLVTARVADCRRRVDSPLEGREVVGRRPTRVLRLLSRQRREDTSFPVQRSTTQHNTAQHSAVQCSTGWPGDTIFDSAIGGGEVDFTSGRSEIGLSYNGSGSGLLWV